MESHAEDIIKIINNNKKKQQLEKNDIHKGYAEIFYDTILFERKSLCNGEFSMIIPSSFDVMKPEHIALKWNTENSPEFIYTNETLDINITFSFCSDEHTEKDISKIQKSMEKNINEINQNIIFIENDILETTEGLLISHFSFPLQLNEQKILEVLFLFFVNHKCVVATFHCPYTQKRDWLNITKQMILSIQLQQ